MIDLEDGVAPEAKTQARAELHHFVTSDTVEVPALVRINSPHDEDGRLDLSLVQGLASRLRAIVVPKADPASVTEAAEISSLPVIALVETAAGVEVASRTAAHPAVVGLVFGSVDYVADVSRHGGWHFNDLSWVASRLVNAAASAGTWALAGPYTRLDHAAGLDAAVAEDRARGFAGKLCIHPGQLATVNDGFSPRPEDLAWARRVVEATGGQDGGAVRVDGQMIDRPLIEQARRLLGAIPEV